MSYLHVEVKINGKPQTMTSPTKPRLPARLRREIIAYLVDQEQPANKSEALEWAMDWEEYDDDYLIETNNHNRMKNKLPARNFE